MSKKCDNCGCDLSWRTGFHFKENLVCELCYCEMTSEEQQKADEEEKANEEIRQMVGINDLHFEDMEVPLDVVEPIRNHCEYCDSYPCRCDTDQNNPVDMSKEAWQDFYARNPDYEDMEP